MLPRRQGGGESAASQHVQLTRSDRRLGSRTEPQKVNLMPPGFGDEAENHIDLGAPHLEFRRRPCALCGFWSTPQN
jgi:hypothetical protein